MDMGKILACIHAMTSEAATAPQLVIAGAPPVPQPFHPEQPHRPRKRRGQRRKARSIYASLSR